MAAAQRLRVCCFTSFSCSYLARARVLAQTLRQAHPDWALHAVLVDQPSNRAGFAAAAKGFDRIVAAETLAIPRIRAWLFKHDIVEACTAVKGQMLVELLDAGFDCVIYLDPDIAIFHPLHSILARLESAAVVLTPHQSAPNQGTEALRDNEQTSLRYGAYNLGFLGVRNDPVGRAFAGWWARQLHQACYDEVENGLFTDQKYCDLVPGLFDRVHIERDPGCNMASWNLSQRTLRFDGGTILVNGSPLKFYHFSKFGAVGDTMTERYAGDNTEVFEIWQWYKRVLEENATTALARTGWHYGRFSNGEPILRAARVLFRRRADLMAQFADPFNIAGDSFYLWLQRNAPQALSRNAPMAAGFNSHTFA